MKHRGEIVKAAIEKKGYKKNLLAENLKFSISKLYRLFEDAMVSYDDIIQIGKIIKYDFSEHFPELANPAKLKAAEENLDYKIRYMQLAEKLIEVMEERDALQKKLNKTK